MRFMPYESSANAVSKTPLFTGVPTDIIICSGEKFGVYSVRSSYRHIFQNILDTSRLKVEGNWSSLWKLKLSLKGKNFLWRLCRNYIPTWSILARCGVPVPSVFPWCNDEYEIPLHLFSLRDTGRTYWRSIRADHVVAATVASGALVSELFSMSLTN